jgi:uncharacterized protein (UPF0276 family)
MWRGAYFPDLLPFPRTRQALLQICSNVSAAQDALGRRIAIENPSHYLRIDGHEWAEIDFLGEIARRTGCGLLLDVNNVYVSAVNHGFSAEEYIAGLPLGRIGQIHLAGHTDAGTHLIDTHDHPVPAPVWTLYHDAVRRFGPIPTLVEWDDRIPPFEELLAEADRARALEAEVLDAYAQPA